MEKRGTSGPETTFWDLPCRSAGELEKGPLVALLRLAKMGEERLRV